MQSKAIKITKIVLNTIFYSIIALILIFSIANINAGGKEGIPNIFGKGYLTVQSESMMPADKTKAKKTSFNKGDLIFVTKLSKNEKSKLQIGDIITFKDVNLKGALNTHRIVDKVMNTSGTTLIGYITQGDRQASLNPYKADNLANGAVYENVSLANIEAKFTSKWSGMGSTMDNISDPKGGFILVIILPTLAFLGFEIFLVIRNMMSIKTHKLQVAADADKDKLKADLELEKEAMRKQILEELRKEEMKNINEPLNDDESIKKEE